MKKWDNNYTVTKKNVEHKQRHKKKTHHTELSREPTPTTKEKKRVPGNQPSPFRWLKKTRRVETPFWTIPLATTRWQQPNGLNRAFFRCIDTGQPGNSKPINVKGLTFNIHMQSWCIHYISLYHI